MKAHGTYQTIPPIKNGVEKSFSNKTKLNKIQGAISISCDHCGVEYRTYAAWIRKSKNHFCSTGCHDAWRTISLPATCEICGDQYFVTPSLMKRKVTCSRKCLKEKRRLFMNLQVSNMGVSPIYNFGVHERGVQISKKLNNDLIRKIRLDNRTQQVIADELCVSQTLISQIKRRLIWGHVL